MSGGREATKYRPSPTSEKKNTMIGHAHATATFTPGLSLCVSCITHAAPAAPATYHGTTNHHSDKKANQPRSLTRQCSAQAPEKPIVPPPFATRRSGKRRPAQCPNRVTDVPEG